MAIRVAVLLVFLLSSAAPVFADTVIDFEEIPVGNYNLVTSQGFTFSNPNFVFLIRSEGTNNYFSPGPENVLMRRLDGLPFNVLTMDFWQPGPPLSPGFQSVALFARFSDGLQEVVIIPGVNAPTTFQTFNIGLNDLVSLGFINGSIQVEIDNIVTTVPEHSTAVLLVVGILLVAWIKGRASQGLCARF